MYICIYTTHTQKHTLIHIYIYIRNSSWVVAVYLLDVCTYKEYIYFLFFFKLVFMSVSGTQRW
jgi:hypothetical protein